MVHREIREKDFSLRILACRLSSEQGCQLLVDFKLKEIQVSEHIRCPTLCIELETFCFGGVQKTKL